MISTKLEPCPFCGGPGKILREDFCPKYRYLPRCSKCDAMVEWWFYTEGEAIIAWNTRTVEKIVGQKEIWGLTIPMARQYTNLVSKLAMFQMEYNSLANAIMGDAYFEKYMSGGKGDHHDVYSDVIGALEARGALYDQLVDGRLGTVDVAPEPCSWCGATPAVSSSANGGIEVTYYWVECSPECHEHMLGDFSRSFENKAEAVLYWNRIVAMNNA